LFSRHAYQFLIPNNTARGHKQKEALMQSTDISQIKSALRDQALIGYPLVCCPIGWIVAVRKRKGQLLAMIRGWGVRWYTVESVIIETRRSRWGTTDRVSDSLRRGICKSQVKPMEFV
jgi:hypothetical protein